MFKHILLPLDGSEVSLKAAPTGTALARALGAKITFITVVTPYHAGVTTPIVSDIVRQLERQRTDEAMKGAQEFHAEVMARAKAEGIACESVVVAGASPYAQIIENAQSRGCDAIVMASHGRRGIDAVLVGSETVKVLTHSTIPVLVVR